MVASASRVFSPPDKVLAGWSDTDRDQLAAHLSRLTHAMDTFVKSA